MNFQFLKKNPLKRTHSPLADQSTPEISRKLNERVQLVTIGSFLGIEVDIHRPTTELYGPVNVEFERLDSSSLFLFFSRREKPNGEKSGEFEYSPTPQIGPK